MAMTRFNLQHFFFVARGRSNRAFITPFRNFTSIQSNSPRTTVTTSKEQTTKKKPNKNSTNNTNNTNNSIPLVPPPVDLESFIARSRKPPRKVPKIADLEAYFKWVEAKAAKKEKFPLTVVDQVLEGFHQTPEDFQANLRIIRLNQHLLHLDFEFRHCDALVRNGIALKQYEELTKILTDESVRIGAYLTEETIGSLFVEFFNAANTAVPPSTSPAEAMTTTEGAAAGKQEENPGKDNTAVKLINHLVKIVTSTTNRQLKIVNKKQFEQLFEFYTSSVSQKNIPTKKRRARLEELLTAAKFVLPAEEYREFETKYPLPIKSVEQNKETSSSA